MERTFHMLIYRLFHAQRSYLRPYVQRIGLGSGQPKLVSYLSAQGACSQKELAAYFEIDPAAVSRMLDSMKKAGFVKIRADENNRRLDVVKLTEKGYEASRHWQKHCRETEEIMLLGFSEKERADFAGFLSRAYKNLKTEQKQGAKKHE